MPGPQSTGLLGSSAQIAALGAASPIHQVGAAWQKPGAMNAGARPLGGVNPSKAIGRAARDFSTAGASDAVADNNASASPPSVSPARCFGCPTCDCDCPEKHPILRPGQWDQAWSNFTRSGASKSTVTLAPWPGAEVFTWNTDVGGGSPHQEFTKPLGMVYHPTGRLMLVYRMTDTANFGQDCVRLRFVILDPQPGDAPWTIFNTFDVDLSDDKDRKEHLSQMQPDGATFWSDDNRLTLFPRQAPQIPSSVPDDNFANYWTLHLQDPGASEIGSGGAIQVCHSATERRTANSMNIASGFMSKMNMAEPFVYTYSRDSGGFWGRAVEHDWRALLFSTGVLANIPGNPQPFPSGGSPPFFHAHTYGDETTLYNGVVGIGSMENAGVNYGSPFLQADGNRSWCANYVTAARAYPGQSGLRGFPPPFPVYDGRTGAANGIDRTKLLEMVFGADGGLDRVVEIYSRGTYTQSDAIRCTHALDAYAAYQASLYPLDATSFVNSEARSDSCAAPPPEGGPHSYNRVTSHTYLGVIYSSIFVTTGVNPPGAWLPNIGVDPGGGFYDNASSAALAADKIIGVGAATMSDAPRSVTSQGHRFCVGSISVPYLTPPHGGATGIPSAGLFFSNRTDPYQKFETFGACSFLTLLESYCFLIPCDYFAYETVFFAISPEGRVSSCVPFPRLENPFHPLDPLMPQAEVHYQTLPIEVLERAFWLHDLRASRLASPVPKISVTDFTAMSVLWDIPSAAIFPAEVLSEVFAEDQVYFDPNAGEIVWARAGELRRGFREPSGRTQSPLMKAFSRGDDHYLIVGVEYYDRVEPNEGIPAEGLEAEDVFTEFDSAGGDQLTFYLTRLPIVTVDVVYLNEDIDNPVGYSWSAGDDFITLDNPLIDPDLLKVRYHYGVPGPGTAGTTTGRTVVLKVTESSYTVEQTSSQVVGWNYPNIATVPNEGANILRLLAIGPDRIVYATDGPALRQVR